MVEPGGSFNYLDGNGRTAVDPLKNLSEQLDDPALVKLMGTCHALRDGEFSRTAPTASEPTGRQVLRDAADTRRANRVNELARTLDADPESLLSEALPIDCTRKNLKLRDVCLLAGLCVRDAASVRATGIRLDGEEEEDGMDGNEDVSDEDDEDTRGYLPLQDMLGGTKSLDLRGHSTLGDLSSLFLGKCIRFNTALRSVDVDGLTLQLDELKGTKPTETIDLCGFKLGVASAIIIADCIKENGVLKELKVDGYALQIDELKGTKPTERIKLSNKGLDVASAIVIASCIKGNGVLKELNLAWNKIRYEGVTKLAEVLCQTKITTLDLAWNGIGDEGVAKLAEVLSQRKLTTLG